MERTLYWKGDRVVIQSKLIYKTKKYLSFNHTQPLPKGKLPKDSVG